MSKHDHYRIITSDAILNLERLVNIALAEGYTICGNLTYMGTLICQPMLKKDNFKEKDE
jgi:hypothetical protein